MADKLNAKRMSLQMRIFMHESGEGCPVSLQVSQTSKSEHEDGVHTFL